MRDWDDIILNFFSALLLILVLLGVIFTCSVSLVKVMDSINFGKANLSKCEVKKELACKECKHD